MSDDTVRKDRKPLRRTERARLDRRTATRLLKLKRIPRRLASRVLMDLRDDPGRVYKSNNLREKWVFASVAAERAATYSGAFDLYAEAADLATLRHYVLRPKATKVTIENLAAGIRELADAYDKHVGRLVTAKKIAPLLCVVHVRFDPNLGLFDLHLHCLWLVADSNLDAVLRGIQTKFSTTWLDEKIRRPGALVNYLTSWVIDHRALQRWPDAALLAVWDLNRPKFIRPAGAFADFKKKNLEGYRVIRDGKITRKVPIRKRRRPAVKASSPAPGTILSYCQPVIRGRRRRCVAVAIDPEKGLSAKQKKDILARSKFPISPVPYSTTETGSTPHWAGPTSPEPQPDSMTAITVLDRPDTVVAPQVPNWQIEPSAAFEIASNAQRPAKSAILVQIPVATRGTGPSSMPSVAGTRSIKLKMDRLFRGIKSLTHRVVSGFCRIFLSTRDVDPP
jgi:hypothetical protein